MSIPNTIEVRTLKLVAYNGQVLTYDEYIRILICKAMEEEVDRKIKKIEKGVKKSEKELKELERMDKKRDPACDLGKEVMKNRKHKEKS